MQLGFDGWFTVIVLLAMFIGLAKEFLSAEIVMFCALCALWAKGIITAEEAVNGFSNHQMLTVGLLFVVSAGVESTGGLSRLTQLIMGKSEEGGRERKRLMARLLIPVAFLSSFMNNTPIVAMMTPAVRDWALRNNFAPSKFLIPLSYATILGGTCTLIGTSTNLVVSGLMEDMGYEPLSMFELLPIGAAGSVVCLAFLMTIGRKLLPDRRSPEQRAGESQREYSVTLEVRGDCPLAGKSVEDAGLRSLRGLFLVEIERAGEIISPVRPTDELHIQDRLTFFGNASTVIDLQKIRGLEPVTEDGETPPTRRSNRLFEVVVSANSPLIGRTLKEANFRRRYDAAVIALHRGGTRLRSKLGDVRLKVGDTLMLQATPGFRATWGGQPDFYLVAQVDEFIKPKYHLAPVSLVILVAMVVLMSTGVLTVLMSVALAALCMVLTGCVKPDAARRSIDISILIMIASSFGISRAVVNSGLADLIAVGFISNLADIAPWAVLAAVYLITTSTTEIMSSNAAAALLLPIAIRAGEVLDRDPRPYCIAVCVAASMSFITPFGYQTNMMVYGPGGYTFSDFVRIGVPMTIITFLVGMMVIPLVWGY